MLEVLLSMGRTRSAVELKCFIYTYIFSEQRSMMRGKAFEQALEAFIVASNIRGLMGYEGGITLVESAPNND